MNKQGINPVTIRGTNPSKDDVVTNLSLARLHFLSDKIGETKKVMSVAVWETEDNILAAMTMDEDKFIQALGHLFPHGELKKAHLEEPDN